MKIKKVKLSPAQKKVEIIKTKKLGVLTGSLGILQRGERFILILRYVQRGKKKEKVKLLFSCGDVELIKHIGDLLSEEKKFPYNSNPISVKEKRARAKSEKNSYQVDTTLFKEFNGQYFIMLSFGSIFIEGSNKFHTKRNYEKIDGTKIFELNMKTSSARFVDLFKTYSEEHKEKILKEVIHFGDSEDRNSVRVMMGMDPIIQKIIPEED